MRSASGWLILAIITIFIVASAPVSGGETSVTFVIRNARVFDGEKIITGATVIVSDGKIAAVAPMYRRHRMYRLSTPLAIL